MVKGVLLALDTHIYFKCKECIGLIGCLLQIPFYQHDHVVIVATNLVWDLIALTLVIISLMSYFSKTDYSLRLRK